MTPVALRPRARLRGLALALLAAVGTMAPAAADDRPGDFDFYVLSLSWSPTYCEDRQGRDSLQCGPGRAYGFVVHGLWPQYERGWPEFCDARAEPRRRTIDAVIDLMPSVGLIRHQWRKHGACTGLDPEDYFDLVRKAHARVVIPPSLRRLDRHVVTSPQAVESAFRAANPAIQGSGIAVSCDGRRLDEVRICMTPDLEFRPCAEVDAKGCRSASVVLPPIR
ncbi:ribonuclease T2 family protein [Methylobrevis pamukkalensis]|uniref:Ribonuclease I n=1 Tax=Methylobrevis pamukkalensis TaxID=1439726 RepID=A0A1E3H551_9HYPH|nr:ribonuclease T [Methylobrevis pamukkalensis]ODN71468.1 Ribonuclease I precursor [Methylobrevis pamukkalensis]